MYNPCIWIVALLLVSAPLNASAQAYQPLQPAFSADDMQVDPRQSRSSIQVPIFNSATQSMQNNPLEAVITKAGELMVRWPTDMINYEQVQNIMQQVPGAANLRIQFPNSTQWATSRNELSGLEKMIANSTGLGNVNLQQLVFTSINQISSATGGGSIAIPVSQIKNGLGSSVTPILQQLHPQNSELFSWMPDWLRKLCYSIYDFIMPYIIEAYKWVMSLFG